MIINLELRGIVSEGYFADHMGFDELKHKNIISQKQLKRRSCQDNRRCRCLRRLRRR